MAAKRVEFVQMTIEAICKFLWHIEFSYNKNVLKFLTIKLRLRSHQ